MSPARMCVLAHMCVKQDHKATLPFASLSWFPENGQRCQIFLFRCMIKKLRLGANKRILHCRGERYDDVIVMELSLLKVSEV
jgi:hypothetical protein